MSKKVKFIINPIAGGVSKENIVSDISNLIDKNHYEYSIIFTEYHGHATLLAEEAVRMKTDIVVAVGGDGTVNEVAKALVGTDSALGIVPCGSGNGLANHLQIPVNLTGALKIINRGFSTRIDSAQINDIPFFCTCGVGYDAKVCNEFTKAGTRGLSTYVSKSISLYFSYKPLIYKIDTGEIEIIRKALIITGANANQWGNNFHVAPKASLKDGLLDLIIIHPIHLINAIPMPIQILGYTFDHNSRVENIKCRSVEIQRGEEGEAHFDGEPVILGRDIRIKVIPDSLNVIVSRSQVSKI